jgi:hypothetical protein
MASRTSVGERLSGRGQPLGNGGHVAGGSQPAGATQSDAGCGQPGGTGMKGPFTGRQPTGTRIQPAGAGMVAACARHRRKSAREGTKLTTSPNRPATSKTTPTELLWCACWHCEYNVGTKLLPSAAESGQLDCLAEPVRQSRAPNAAARIERLNANRHCRFTPRS